jgi:ATP-dependent Zn protease
MNFSISNKNRLLVLLFTIMSISPVAGSSTQPEVQHAPQQVLAQLLEEETIEKMLEIAHHQWRTLNAVVQNLNLMVANQAIRLSTPRALRFVQTFKQIKSALTGAAQQLQVKSLRGITNAVSFNAQLAEYLLRLVKSDLKVIPPFAYRIPTEEITLQEAAVVMTNTLKTVQVLEHLIKDLGVTKYQRMMRSIHAIDTKYKVSDKIKLVGFATFAGMLLRYLQKLNVDDQPGAPVIAAQPEENGWWRWFDETVIGNPYKTNYTPGLNGRFTFSRTKAANSGIFGNIHFYMEPILVAAGFATLIKSTSDKFVADMHAWKGLYKDPKEYVKLNELMHNEKQTVSPIEELFLLNAFEHYEPRFTFDQVVGLHEQKKELRPVINYLLNPELFEKTGTSVEKGFLFYGPTRTGKTYLAEALAGELVHKHGKKLAFLKIKGGDLRFVGIKKVLEIVKKFAPCIVFIDELDLLNLQRDQNTQLLEEFLTGMRTDDGKQVVFLAATNRIDHIDHALRQPGRFGKIITFENPSYSDRKEFFEHELKMRNIHDESRIDVERLTMETQNCTYGDLASILNHGLTKSMQTRQVLGYEHFENGIDVIKRKIIDSDPQIPAAERVIISTHLAGHALAYTLLPTSEVLHKVTILPIQKQVIEEKAWLSDFTSPKKITTFGEVFTLHPLNTAGFDSYEQKMNKVKALLAGHAAEKLVLGASAYNYHADDYDQARVEIEAVVFKGLKKDQLSRAMLDAKADEVQQMIKKCEDDVTQFLTQNRAGLEKVAALLNKNLTLSREDILQALGLENPRKIS